METACQTCAGRGSTLKRNGVVLEEGRGATGRPKPVWAQSVPERAESLRKDLGKIESSLSKYEAEAAGCRSRLEQPGLGEEERGALLDLVEQLTKVIDKLK